MILLAIENLSNEVDEQEIEKLFSRHGKVRSIKLQLCAPRSRSPSSGLIELQGNDATSVISALDGSLFGGMVLRVTEARGADQTDMPAADSIEPAKPSTTDSNNYLHQPFRVVSVKQVTDPELGPAEDWFRYTLQSGKSCITGLHRGTLGEVTEFAEECAEAFNLRNQSKGRRSITWSSRTKK